MTLVLGTLDALDTAAARPAAAATPAPADGAAARSATGARLWPQLLYMARHLPSTFAFLESHLLAPSRAAAAEAQLVAAEAAAEAAGGSNSMDVDGGRGAADGVLALARQTTTWADDELGAADAGTPLGAAAEDAPFSRHVLVALEGSSEESGSFSGMAVLSSHWLHAPQALEPARATLTELGRCLGRCWLLSMLYLDGWKEAWLLMALEGHLTAECVAAATNMPLATSPAASSPQPTLHSRAPSPPLPRA